MVEMNRETKPRTVYAADWAALFERFRHGEEPAVLAADFNLAVSTVESRCRWIEKAFPTRMHFQKLVSFRQGLERAEAHLTEGDPVRAEREARALLALIRAAKALEGWTMEKPNSKTQGAPVSEPEVSHHEDARAELEARLLRLLAIEAKRQRGGRSEGSETQNPSDERDDHQ